jgi:hypothetical protein
MLVDLHRLTSVAMISCAALLLSCGKECPTVGCRPEITIEYETAISQPYEVSVRVGSFMANETCPKTTNSTPPGLDTGTVLCDGSHVLVQGLNLGHGDVATIDVEVTITANGATVIERTVVATLSRVLNSTECDEPCYLHRGTL